MNPTGDPHDHQPFSDLLRARLPHDPRALLTDADLHCGVEVTDGIVSLLAPGDSSAMPAMRAIARAVPGVVAVEAFC